MLEFALVLPILLLLV
ncbi:MAG TPA: hypothetical protein GXX59_02640, partial [Syntrophomonadaceae bacterium]|nr:hypothetical protein [Syntrophomonadaceae bacterium]